MKQLRGRGGKAAPAGIKKAEEIYHSGKHHQLFAKTKAEKKKILQQLIKQSEQLVATTKAVIQQVSTRWGRVKQQAAAPVQGMGEVWRQLLPQIKYGLKTGKVATEKILHAGLPAARAIVKGKGRVKFADANGFCGHSRKPPIEEAIKKLCSQFG